MEKFVEFFQVAFHFGPSWPSKAEKAHSEPLNHYFRVFWDSNVFLRFLSKPKNPEIVLLTSEWSKHDKEPMNYM